LGQHGEIGRQLNAKTIGGKTSGWGLMWDNLRGKIVSKEYGIH
jgi:hypothetical protein